MQKRGKKGKKKKSDRKKNWDLVGIKPMHGLKLEKNNKKQQHYTELNLGPLTLRGNGVTLTIAKG